MSFKSGPKHAESETWEGIPPLPQEQGFYCRRGTFMYVECVFMPFHTSIDLYVVNSNNCSELDYL